MDITGEQIEAIRQWAEAGANLSDIQKKMESELNIRMTYMDVRFLIDDHEIELGRPTAATETNDSESPEETAVEELNVEPEELLPASVSVSLDRLTRPGTVVSGDVTFTDGVSAKWYLDQMGRLGLDCKDKEYRPSEDDVKSFQEEIQRILQEKGF